MWKKISWSKALFIAVFLFLSFLCVGTCWANPTYTISETELETLQNHLNALEQNNETLKAILTTQDESLTVALDALMKSQKELNELKVELQRARSETQNARQSLETANLELAKASESFRQSEKEHDRIEGRLRTQRNVWEALFAIAVGVAVAR